MNTSDLVSIALPRKGGLTDLQNLREKLRTSGGERYWRTLEEAADTEEFRELVQKEFPSFESPGNDRRTFLRLMSASLAMAGLTACTRQPKELIVPYVRQPENVVPGLALFYATAFPVDGYARGILVESHLNRPTKIEGNPDHPASLGATDIFTQASVLTLYDPDRSKNVLHRGELSTWYLFAEALEQERKNIDAQKGEGLAILSANTTSPTFLRQMQELRQRWPSTRWYIHEPGANPAQSQAIQQITGAKGLPHYDLSKADVIVSLESDFLNCGPASLNYARQFAARRGVDAGEKPSRLYVFESSPTVTANLADHRIPLRSDAIPEIAYLLAQACGASVPSTGASMPSWMSAIANDLKSARGRSLVVAGEYQPASVHLAAHVINEALGNIGQTVSYLESVEALNTANLESLANDLNSGQVETLLILGANPVYTSADALGFKNALRKARFIVHSGIYYDETAHMCHWHVPEAHYLETWADSRAFDGTATIQQPLIAPMYDSKSIHEVLAILAGNSGSTSHDLTKSFWRDWYKGNDFDSFWQASVHDGFVRNTSVKALTPGHVTLAALEPTNSPGGTIELVFRPDPTIGTGVFSNNAWLQELPKPQTKLTWDNTVWISPKLAADLHLSNKDVIELSANGHVMEAPVWIVPGHSKESVTIHWGYGRDAGGRVCRHIGYNAYRLQPKEGFTLASVSLKKTGKTYWLAETQAMQDMAGRDPVRATTLAEFQSNPKELAKKETPVPEDVSLYPPVRYEGYKWGMSIDLNVCTGCSACIIACQAENNIAVVGKGECAKGRQMHWIRVDRYYRGNLDEPEVFSQPVPCMQCEDAPCELVCPVAATVHSTEGINEMVYNRCVGTRYCSNNCPYKVRRFNFYLYSDWQTESLYGLRNPDVTVRSRGVMEKCSYCIQRINEAKIRTERENRRLRDGEIETACQQVCPTRAIAFGDLNLSGSAVAKLSKLDRKYALLGELNTRPRTTYLGRVQNPNEALRGPLANREG